MLEINNGTIPSPWLRRKVTRYLESIGGIYVSVIAPFASSGTRFRHIYGESIDLTVAETVASQKVIFLGRRPVFHETLDSKVKTIRVDVFGEDPLFAVRAGFSVEGLAGFQRGTHTRSNSSVGTIVTYSWKVQLE